MFKFSFLLFATIIVSSCENIENDSMDNLRSDLNIREIHDSYSQMACDLISEWRLNNELNEEKIDVLWDIIHKELAVTLNTTEEEIGLAFYEIGFTAENWTTISETHSYLMSSEELDFLNDLRSGYEAHHNESDEFLLAMFDEKEEYWSSKLDKQQVHETIEIAKSSFIFWNRNFENCLLGGSEEEIELRAANWCAIGKLAYGDAWGAAAGSGACGAGALLGAVGGTLGATIGGAIFDYGC